MQDGFCLTMGELFADGGGIDMLQRNRLVVWENGQEEVGENIRRHEHYYVAAAIEPTLLEALHFPSGIEDSVSTEQLVADIQEGISDFVSCDERSQFLLSTYILSTWVGDCLPTPPVLNLWGPSGAALQALEPLSCLVRRPLLLSDVTSKDLCELPTGLTPTLIVGQPSKKSVQQICAAATTPQVSVLRNGRLISYRYATVLVTRSPLPAPVLSLAIGTPAESHVRMDAVVARALTEELTPRLLHYRLTHHFDVRHSQFDLPGFAWETRILARVLGGALEGAPALQTRMAEELSCVDEQQKVDRSQELAAIVVEALLALCHEQQQEAYIDEVAKLTNIILLGRHEPIEVTSKKVGTILRQELGLYARRKGAGYALLLDASTRSRVHRLANTYAVLTGAHAGCSDCGNESTDSAAEDLAHELPGLAGQSDVHDVQNVHDVHPSEQEGGA